MINHQYGTNPNQVVCRKLLQRYETRPMSLATAITTFNIILSQYRESFITALGIICFVRVMSWIKVRNVVCAIIISLWLIIFLATRSQMTGPLCFYVTLFIITHLIFHDLLLRQPYIHIHLLRYLSSSITFIIRNFHLRNYRCMKIRIKYPLFYERHNWVFIHRDAFNKQSKWYVFSIRITSLYVRLN